MEKFIPAPTHDAQTTVAPDNTLVLAIDLFKHEDSQLNIQATGFVGVHSFLVLAVAISLGQTTTPGNPKQRVFGFILAFTGLLLGLLQITVGTRALRRIRQCALSVETLGSQFTEHSQVFTHRRSLLASVRLNDQDPRSIVGGLLPCLLLCFWIAVTAWVGWRG